MPRANAPPMLSQEANRRVQHLIDKAKLALAQGGDAKTAIGTLQASLGGEKNAFHDAILALLDDSPGNLKQQLVDQALIRHQGFNLDARDKNGKTALDLAVQHKDPELTSYLLSKGANPECASIIFASPEMQMLLTSHRRKNLIYAHHSAQHKEDWTVLDHALQEGNYVMARSLLQRIKGERSLEQAWEESLDAGQHDFLRALLIVGTPDELRELTRQKFKVGEWKMKLCEDPLLQDPGLAAAIAEFPYQSAKRVERENLNGDATFPNTLEQIWCRHLATYIQQEQARDPSGKLKFDYNKFKSVDAIEKNVPHHIEEIYKALEVQAPEKYLVNNVNFGRFLAGQFSAMEKKNESTRQMLIKSHTHVMNLALRIKEKHGQKSYGVNYFDPNVTTTHMHGKASSLQTLETQKIEDYLAEGLKNLDFYYGNKEGFSCIYVRPEEEHANTINSSNSSAGRTSITYVENINATVIWNLMAYGFAENLQQLQDHLKTLSEDQRFELLAGKLVDGAPILVGTPALYMAMAEGKTEAIKAYGELLMLVPENKRIELLAGMDEQDGVPALFIGMQSGHAKPIKAYGELLKTIPEKERIELLMGKTKAGCPALHTAIHEGCKEAIKAYSELLKDLNLSADQQADLLLVKDDTPENGLEQAMKEQKFGMCTTLLKLLEGLLPNLSPEKKSWLRNELKDFEVLISNSQLHTTALQEWSQMNLTFSKLKTALGD